LQIPDDKARDVLLRLTMAARDAGFRDATSYVDHLFSCEGAEERDQVLASVLTVGETYFFRDLPLLESLEEIVLPEIVVRKRKDAHPVLRLWSAGCSTGEEPYTLAMIVHCFLSSHPGWDFSVLATDVNERALETARAGRYRPWSFRRPVPAPYEKYLAGENGRREVLPELRDKVVFRRLNLAEGDYPSPETENMDLLFCRNVLMYLDPDVRAAVLDRFHRCLADGGYLVTAAVEMAYVDATRWERVRFSKAILFRKNPARERTAAGVPSFRTSVLPLQGRLPLHPGNDLVLSAPKRQAASHREGAGQQEKETPHVSSRFSSEDTGDLKPVPPVPKEIPKPRDISAQCPLLKPATGFRGDGGNVKTKDPDRPPEIPSAEDLRALVNQGELESALERATAALEQERSADDVLRRMVSVLVQALSNAGRRDDAVAFLERAASRSRLDPAYPMLKASLCCEAGDREGAIAAYRQALYLDSSLAAALLGLGTLFQASGNIERARRSWLKALEILEAREPEEDLAYGEGLSVGQARALLHHLLAGRE
jgi:chemotaxis protein methyltransferase CheR